MKAKKVAFSTFIIKKIFLYDMIKIILTFSI
jgi:hypothetical protein